MFFGALLVFVLPGFAIITALFPEAILSGPERLLLTMGVSLVVTLLCGLVLNFLPGGLQALGWCYLLSGITVATSIGAWLRGGGNAVSGRRLWKMRSVGTAVTSMQLTLVLIGVLLAASISVAATIWSLSTPVMQLWMLPVQDQPGVVRIGVHQNSTPQVLYHLEVLQAERVMWVWPAVTVTSDGSWETTISLPRDADPNLPFEARLYAGLEPKVLVRWTRMWMKPSPAGSPTP
jgi:hypothetical protein